SSGAPRRAFTSAIQSSRSAMPLLQATSVTPAQASSAVRIVRIRCSLPCRNMSAPPSPCTPRLLLGLFLLQLGLLVLVQVTERADRSFELEGATRTGGDRRAPAGVSARTR